MRSAKPTLLMVGDLWWVAGAQIWECQTTHAPRPSVEVTRLAPALSLILPLAVSFVLGLDCRPLQVPGHEAALPDKAHCGAHANQPGDAGGPGPRVLL